MSLLQMSVSGAVMILTVIVIRALAFYKLPKRTFPILWYIVLARLLVPYTLPCAVSVYSLLNGTQAAESQEPLPDAEFTAVSSDAVFIVPSEGTAENIPVSFIDNVSAPPIDIRTAVWLAGMLGFAAFFTVSYIKCRKTFSESLPADNDFTRNWLENHRLFRRVSIRYSDRITAPLTYGVFRPVILMPKNTDWTNANDLKYVMAHEYVHIRRFDAVFKLTLTAALCVHWFNPLVWAMFFIANKDIELSCDEAVIRMFGENSKSAYAMALIHMEEKKSGFFPLGVNFGKNAVEERIMGVMKYKKFTPITFAVTICLVIGITAFATSVQVRGSDLTEQISQSNGLMTENELTYNSESDITEPNIIITAAEAIEDTAMSVGTTSSETGENLDNKDSSDKNNASAVNSDKTASTVEELLYTAPLAREVGELDLTGKYNFIAAEKNSDVFAMYNGEVVFAQNGWNKGNGHAVIIKYGENDYIIYCHLMPDSFKVKKGDTVIAGQLIGNVGISGQTDKYGLGIRYFDKLPSFVDQKETIEYNVETTPLSDYDDYDYIRPAEGEIGFISGRYD